MTTTSTNTLYQALCALLPIPEMVDRVWDHQRDVLDIDRFVDDEKFYLHLCMNQSANPRAKKHQDMSINNARIILFQALTQAGQHHHIWNVWIPPKHDQDEYQKALSEINNWPKELIQQNIQGIAGFIQHPLDWSKHVHLLQYGLPLLDENTQDKVWSDICENVYYEDPMLTLDQAIQVYNETSNKNIRKHIVEYMALKYQRLLHDKLHPLLDDLNTPNIPKMPDQLQLVCLSDTSIIKIVDHAKDANHTIYSRLTWDDSVWADIHEIRQSPMHKAFDDALIPHLQKLSDEYEKKHAAQYWDYYDALVYLPKITAWCLEYYREYDLFPDECLHFAAYVHGLEIPRTGQHWLSSYRKRQNYNDSMGYRDWCMKQYTSEQLLQWLHLLTIWDKTTSQNLRKHPIEFGHTLHYIGYTLGDLAHPDEWREALVQERTSIVDIELKIVLKRWFPEADFAMVDDLKTLVCHYAPLLDMHQSSTWMMMFQELQQRRLGTPMTPLAIEGIC